MATENIYVSTDSKVKAEASQIFESIGLDMPTAINIFLKQTIKRRNLPFSIGAQPTTEGSAVRPPLRFGTLDFTISDDFDAPLDDFSEYMK
jgi:DNA-damage-inducible protein J